MGVNSIYGLFIYLTIYKVTNLSRCFQLYLEKLETILLIIQDISNLEISKFIILKN